MDNSSCLDPDSVELSKLLDMKGLKRGDQLVYLDIFKDTDIQVSDFIAGVLLDPDLERGEHRSEFSRGV